MAKICDSRRLTGLFSRETSSPGSRCTKVHLLPRGADLIIAGGMYSFWPYGSEPETPRALQDIPKELWYGAGQGQRWDY